MIRRKRKNFKPVTNTNDLVQNRINSDITSFKIQLVGDNVPSGTYSLKEALDIADSQQLDLVELTVTPEGVSVCRVLDYNKFVFEKKKKSKEIKAKNKISETKEIRFTPNTDEHDFAFKLKHAQNFLQEGNKVKVMLQFKGRSIMYKDRGIEMINKLVDAVREFGVVEENISEDRRRMNAVIAPLPNKKK